jgi:plastocyanin
MRSTHRRLGSACALLLVAGAILVAGCKDDNPAGGGGVTPDVTINIVAGAATQGMAAFSAPSATVHVGNVVRLHNGDSITHNIVADTMGGPTWGTIGAGANRDVTVTAAGSFPFHCTISGHNMTGTLVVQP